jgi:hypothetical protein
MRQLQVTLVPIGFFLLVGWVLWLTARFMQKRAQARVELRHRLLDKFSDSKELAALLEIDEGKLLMHAVLMERSVPERILNSIQVGLVFTVAGVGALVLSRSLGSGSGLLLIGGAFGTTLGAGLLLSAGIGYRLAKAWGVMSDAQSSARVRATRLFK